MSIPDWPALWKREPGLRPDALAQYAALCRDAAVQWLASLGNRRDLRIENRKGEWAVEVWTVMAGGEEDICDVSEIGPTLDHALYAACRAVLDTPKP
jgi:hypothetical protein